MPLFSYEAISADGARSAGQLDATSAPDAASSLRGRGLRILRLAPGVAASRAARSWLLSERLQRAMPVGAKDLVFFFQHLGMMLRSGLTATSALHLATDEAAKPRLRQTLAGLTRRVEMGEPLSQALSAHPLFPPLAAGIIASAEETGELADGCERIAESLEFWRQLRAKVLQSIIYPAIVLLLAVGVSILLVFFFLPKVEKFLRNAGRGLPPITKALFDFTHFVQTQWPWLLLLLAALLGLFAAALRWPRSRRWLELAALNVPVLGRVLEAAVIARLAGLLAVLLRSGSDLVRSLSLGVGLTRVMLYRDALTQATEQLIAGRSLRQAMDHPLIPRTVLGIVAAGEESGSLVRAFEELEKFYGYRLSTLVLTLVALMEPLLLICVGGVVAVVYIALFSAIMSLAR